MDQTHGVRVLRARLTDSKSVTYCSNTTSTEKAPCVRSERSAWFHLASRTVLSANVTVLGSPSRKGTPHGTPT